MAPAVKALVLCAGLGTRLRPFTLTTAKHLIPVANRPVLFHVVDALRDAGADELGVIVSRDSRPPIEQALGDGRALGVRARYIEQVTPRGLGDAVGCARDFVGGESFYVYLGDTLIPEGLGSLVAGFRPGVDAALMLKPVDDPRSFGIAVIEGDRIRRLVEKPQQPPGNLAIVGAYAFTSEIFAAIDRLQPSWRGEYEITDAIQDLIDRGLDVRACLSPGWWKDAGKPEDVLDANDVMLEKLRGEVHGTVDGASQVEGDVVVGKDAHIVHSVVRGPAVIGAGARIENAEVGPYVSVGDRSTLSRCKISRSLIMEDAAIIDVPQPLVRSIVGRRAEVRGGGATRVVLGDFSRVEL